MKQDKPITIFALLLAIGCLLTAQITIHAASVTDGYPGDPNTWDGLTTNTIIEIKLDTPVEMVGNPPVPDIDYCVKKCEFSGLDFVFTDVSCDVEVSDDRKVIKFYPNDLLGENALFAYKIIDINFEGGSSQQNFANYFETGNNPIPSFATQIDESDMCDDEGGGFTPSHIWPWCVRCHTDWKQFVTCDITP